MRPFANSKTIAASLYWLLILVISCTAVQADERVRRSITAAELWQDRPANLFKMSENNDPSVCEPLISALNTPMRIASLPVRSVFEHRRPSKPKPFPLLRNKFIIDPWKRQEFYWHLPKSDKKIISSWEAAFVDLDGDGSAGGIFRRLSTIGGVSYHVLNYLEKLGNSVRTKRVWDEDFVRKIMRNNKINFRRFDAFPNHRQLVELIKIQNKIFLLISRAYFTTLSEKPRFPRIQLLKRTSGKFERVCLFDGQILITP